jgi:hypothetical protein
MNIATILAALFAVTLYFATAATPAYAGCTCADLDGDGIAETCICPGQ